MGKGNMGLLIDEEKIVAAFESQDQSVLGRIFQVLFPKVKRYVLQNSGSVEDSEDLMNEAFMAVYTQILSKKYQHRGKFEPFFMIICRNIWLKKLRQKRFQSETEVELLAVADQDNEAVEQIIEEDRMIQRILSEMENLGPDCRKLLNLFYYEKKRLREIAGVFGWTEKFAKNKKSRCMKALRKLVNT